MSRLEWWATLIGLTVRDAILAVCGSLAALEYIPDRATAVTMAILIPTVVLPVWTWVVVSIVRSRHRVRRFGAQPRGTRGGRS